MALILFCTLFNADTVPYFSFFRKTFDGKTKVVSIHGNYCVRCIVCCTKYLKICWVFLFSLFVLSRVCARASERATCFTREAEVYFSRYPTCCYKHGFFFSSVKLLSILNCKTYSPFQWRSLFWHPVLWQNVLFRSTFTSLKKCTGCLLCTLHWSINYLKKQKQWFLNVGLESIPFFSSVFSMVFICFIGFIFHFKHLPPIPPLAQLLVSTRWPPHGHRLPRERTPRRGLKNKPNQAVAESL